MHSGLFGICAAAIGAFLPQVAAVYECNATYLKSFSDDYVKAHEMGQLYHLDNIADNFTASPHPPFRIYRVFSNRGTSTWKTTKQER